ncbi:MAG: Ferredoxin subunit of nitrite reductase and ring-hydroxylating dioxygenase [Sphingomonas bacterium]|jgi:nitrite reductase/ring-hydroxylating ferredoxin subunit|nr:Rieske 2Fe-2S domain-containing protein [Sphingomonas bacterium]MDB5688757.1 Ferredoxin subunit of nitrite reductase and ring-hydroxylating dioxygenase [Sphingomonas bacterium]
MARHVVAALAEVPPGSRKLVQVKGRDVALFNVAGELFAVLDRCPHAGASLCRGGLTGLMSATGPGQYELSREGEILRCPWHGWEFDLRTGKSCAEPNKLWIKNFEVSVAEPDGLDDGEVRALAPEAAPETLVATTFPVSVDDKWIVIEA